MPNPLTKEVLSGGIAHFSIGKEEVPFDAHVELLCDRCPYFDDLFQERFNDGAAISEVVSFPDIEPDTFTEFLSWKYRGMIFQDIPSPAWVELFRLWVLADKFGLKGLKSRVESLCLAKDDAVGAAVDEEAVQYAFENTPEGSILRHMAVVSWVERATSAQVSAYAPKSPAGFINLVAVALVEKRTSRSQNGTAGTSPFEQTDSSTDPPDGPRFASRAQMANRKIISPRPRSDRSAF